MKNKSIHITYISIIIAIFVIIAGRYYYFHQKGQAMHMAMNQESVMHMTNGKIPPMKGMMVAITPPPLSDQQTQQLTEGTDTGTTKKVFNITAGNFYFTPNKITVNKGDQVTFYVTNAGGIHDLVINELGVKTPISKTATTETYTFTASKTGSFVYYCSVPGHRAKGMWGTLVVQ